MKKKQETLGLLSALGLLVFSADASVCEQSDFNNDGVVNSADQAEIMGRWNFSACDADGKPNENAKYDLDRDCRIGSGDNAILLGCWGPLASVLPATLDETYVITEPGTYTGATVWVGPKEKSGGQHSEIIRIEADNVTLREVTLTVDGSMVLDNTVRAILVKNAENTVLDRVTIFGVEEGMKVERATDFLATECSIGANHYGTVWLGGSNLTVRETNIHTVAGMTFRAGVGEIVRNLRFENCDLSTDSNYTMGRFGTCDNFVAVNTIFSGRPEVSSLDIGHDGQSSSGWFDPGCIFNNVRIELKAMANGFYIRGHSNLEIATPAVRVKGTKPGPDKPEQVVQNGDIDITVEYADKQPDVLIDLIDPAVTVRAISAYANGIDYSVE